MLEVLFPLACPGCGAPGAPVCTRCRRRLRAPVPAPPPAGIDAWWAAFAYEGAARELVARVKYRNVRAVVPWLAGATVAAVPAAARRSLPGVVTWAPTGRDRRRQRGFDPAELLARAVARGLGARCVGLLDRLPGPAQTGLTGDARRRGPRFVAAPGRARRASWWSTTSPPPAPRSPRRRPRSAPPMRRSSSR